MLQSTSQCLSGWWHTGFYPDRHGGAFQEVVEKLFQSFAQVFGVGSSSQIMDFVVVLEQPGGFFQSA
jgi:hypothetical protein